MNLDTALLSLPKVLLHEHLDGVLRPQTVIGLAGDVGYGGLPSEIPSTGAVVSSRRESGKSCEVSGGLHSHHSGHANRGGSGARRLRTGRGFE